MWILHFLPDSFILWFTNALLIAGVGVTLVAFFLKIIPFVNIYRLPLQILGVVLLVIGVYLRGGYGVEMEWRERVRALEAQIAVSEQKSAELNQQLAQEIEKKRAARRELSAAVQKNITENREAINAECKLNPAAVDAYNQAVRGGKK
jgi:uncharacterized coiled-coil protein SlyX